MSDAFWDMPVNYVRGVGAQWTELLASEVGIRTTGDLLSHFPFRYVDKSIIHPMSEVNEEMPYAQVRGTLGVVVEEGQPRKKRLKAILSDETGSLELIWFQGLRWVKPLLIPGKEYLAFGKPSRYGRKTTMAHPEMEVVASDFKLARAPLVPVYSTTEKLTAKGLSSKGFIKLIQPLLPELPGRLEETLSADIMERYKLIGRARAYQQVHRPSSADGVRQAQRRLKFEELFFLQLSLLRQKLINQHRIKGYVLEAVGEHFNHFYHKRLPFQLTGAQKRVLKEIRRDMHTGAQMNRLLQGDVGSGKTLVALLSMLLAIDNGYQASLMAPTEILANQHFETITGLLGEMDIKVALLTGSIKQAKRKWIHEGLEDGSIHILIGTHALLEKKVQFMHLGLAVIDEQHRFGVAQRARFWKKSQLPPHILVMTATPIPRTLAMTVYGDLDVSTIDEMPPGRKDIITTHRYDSARLAVFQFIQEEIALGRQVYIVYPLIDESEKLDYKNLMDGYESICRRFPLPNFRVSIVHGQMKPENKDYEMQRFVRGETQIMVATTVIEVGVNVPNASVMVIESAQRFGLSQLHQLRGRVGRGAEQSYCILMTEEKLSADARTRIKTMVQTNDGFKIAEVDLALRGPGDIMGTQQSGLLNLRIANLATDQPILTEARATAVALLESDPDLDQTENEPVRKCLQEMERPKMLWSRIS